MSPSRPFIMRPIATSLIMIAILLTGILAYKLLPVSALPQVDYPTIQVATFFPGASPYVMASSVTAPLERQLGQMAGLKQMTSNSSTGASTITLQFLLETSLDVAEQEVQESINAASTYLPADLPNQPIYSKVNPADAPIITLALTSNTIPLTQVEDIADTRLAQKIAQLSGVGLVSISGGQRPAVRVQVNPNALASYGLTLETVRNALAQANVNQAKGSFDGPLQSYTINSNDQLLTSADYMPLIIAFNSETGGPVRISDIGKAIDGAENVQKAAWKNLTQAIIVNIQRQPGANVIAVVDSIKKLLPQLQATIPKGIDLTILTDRTLTIRASVADAQFEMMLSIALVVMVIFIFLRNIPATVIPSFSVPLSLIGTFGVMYLLGFSINNLTLMALTIATGFVVDDAIVMIENITRYIEQGYPRLEAALKGAGQIGFTIVSLTISLIAVLIPLLFMQDIIGRLFREFAITLAVAILLSGFVSLTLTPMLCSRMLSQQAFNKNTKFERTATHIQDRIVDFYSKTLRWVLNHQPLTLIVFFITLLLTLMMLYFIPKGFFPIEDTGVIQGVTEAPQSISFDEMANRQQNLARVVLQDPAVENLSSFIGIDSINTTLNTGRMLITLKPLDDRDADASEVIRRLQTKLNNVPGITLFMQPVQDITIDDRVTRTQYQYSLNSPDEQEVAKYTNLLVEKLHEFPEVTDVASDLQNKGLQTMLTIDRDTASRLGITAQTIDDTLYDAFGQRQVSIMFTQVNQYRVVLEALPYLQKDPSALNNIFLTSSNGDSIPLSTFTKVTQQLGPTLITRQGQFPVANVSFNLSPTSSLGDAIAAVNKAKQEINIPMSIQTSFEGAAKAFQSSLGNEGWLIVAAIIAVYIILGVLYESYIHPLTILSTLPSACLGALFALQLLGLALTVIAVIGIILLIGIVMKNAILMIDFALELERTDKKPPAEAIFEACLLRFRPIFMTTLVAMLGAVPLAFGTGMGAELRQPLGITIIAGLIVSQLLTLYTTPVIYISFDKLARRLANLKLRWSGPNISSTPESQ